MLCVESHFIRQGWVKLARFEWRESELGESNGLIVGIGSGDSAIGRGAWFAGVALGPWRVPGYLPPLRLVRDRST